jgi:Leucine-rich repeat (LRR) protein/predicted transcriptional regulator YdeE
MKTIFLGAILSICIFLPSNGQDELRIKTLAAEFITERGKSTLVADLEVSYSTKEALPNSVLILKNKLGGYIVVQISDSDTNVVGWSLKGNFKLNEKNSVFRAITKTYETSSINTAPELLKLKSTPATISPLLDIEGIAWNQDFPYNLQCPDTSLAGCVAVAMGQILRYHKHPQQGIGSHSYTHDVYGELSADFGATTYNWDNMPGSLADTNSDVAQLLFHLGVSVNMDYSHTGSSASSGNAYSSFIEHFNYQNTVFLGGDAFPSYDKFYETMKTELANGRPMYFDLKPGTVVDDGHAVVCDGYNGEYFHLNFGWGGNENGYFLLSGLGFFGASVFYMDPTVIMGLSPNYIPCNVQDSLALVAIYDSTGGSSWKRGQNWLTGKVSEWEGVTTINGRVRLLYLNDFGLQNSLPSQIGDLTGLYSLMINNNDVTGLPLEIGNLNELYELNASDNNITEFPEGIFNCAGLNSINLRQNNLTTLPEAGYEKLQNLTSLNISYNTISGELPSGIWSLPKLTYLDAESNLLGGIGDIPDSIISRPLVQFLASDNSITSFSSTWGKLDSLEYIYLQNNQISDSIPSSIRNLKRLRVLNLSNNNIQTIPTEISELDSLRKLYLAKNELSILPSGIGGMGALEELFINNNQLNWNALPEEIGQLNKLQLLKLTNNKISYIPIEIGEIETLKYCYLDSNEIVEIPESIGQLSNLEILGVGYNKIEDVPVNINQLDKMISVDFSHNKLQQINAGVSYMPNLIHLDISNNQINNDLPALQHLNELNALDISYNALNFSNIATSGITLHNFSGLYYWSYQDTILLSEHNYTVAEEDSIRIDITEISSLSHPDNNYIWYREGEIQHFSEGKELHIPTMTSELEGTYYCKIENNEINYHLNLFTQGVHITMLVDEQFSGNIYTTEQHVSNIIADDTIYLRTDAELRGTITWEVSKDSSIWISVENAHSQGIISHYSQSSSELTFVPLEVAAYRYKVEEENCNALYSDTVVAYSPYHLIDTLINASSGDAIIRKEDFQVIVPKGFYHQDFRLTVDKLSIVPQVPDTVVTGHMYDVKVSFGSEFDIPLLITLSLDTSMNELAKNIDKYKAVFYNESTHLWEEYTDALITMRDTVLAFETNHLTRLGWWRTITTGGYSHFFENNDVTVYYNPLNANFSNHYTTTTGTKPWHVGELDVRYGTPTYIQDICYYTYLTRKTLKDDYAISIPEKFTVYVKDLVDSDGICGIMGMLKGYTVIDDDIYAMPGFTDLRSVCAHEYWHYTQDDYITMSKGNIFWTEATAHLTDRLIWDETEMPESESMKFLSDNLKGKYSFFKTLSNAWDTYDYSTLGHTVFGSLEYSYQAGIFLHYMRSYRSGTKLDPVLLLKNTSWMGSWKNYLDGFIQSEMSSDIGSEYGNFVRYLMEGSNEKFSLFAPNENQKSNPLQYIQGAVPEFIQKKFITTMKTNSPDGILTDSVEFILPGLSAQMFELNNLVKDSIMFVKFLGKHDKNDKLKEYICIYDADKNGFDLRDIAALEEANLSLLPKSIENDDKYDHQAYLLVINESKDEEFSVKYHYEMRGVIPISKIDCNFQSNDGSIPSTGNGLLIHTYDDTEIREWFIYAVDVTSEITMDPENCIVTINSLSDDGSMSLQVVQNILDNTISIQYSRTSTYEFAYDSDLGDFYSGIETHTKAIVLNNMPAFAPGMGYLKFHSSTLNTAQTQSTVQSIYHEYTDERNYNSGGSNTIEYNYVSTDYDVSTDIKFVMQME